MKNVIHIVLLSSSLAFCAGSALAQNGADPAVVASWAASGPSSTTIDLLVLTFAAPVEVVDSMGDSDGLPCLSISVSSTSSPPTSTDIVIADGDYATATESEQVRLELSGYPFAMTAPSATNLSIDYDDSITGCMLTFDRIFSGGFVGTDQEDSPFMAGARTITSSSLVSRPSFTEVVRKLPVQLRTGSSQVEFEVNFSKPVNGIPSSSIDMAGSITGLGGISTFTITPSSGSSYVVTVSGYTWTPPTEGSIQLVFSDLSGIQSLDYDLPVMSPDGSTTQERFEIATLGIDEARFLDSDSNGTIDTVRISFTHPVDINTVASGNLPCLSLSRGTPAVNIPISTGDYRADDLLADSYLDLVTNIASTRISNFQASYLNSVPNCKIVFSGAVDSSPAAADQLDASSSTIVALDQAAPVLIQVIRSAPGTRRNVFEGGTTPAITTFTLGLQFSEPVKGFSLADLEESKLIDGSLVGDATTPFVLRGADGDSEYFLDFDYVSGAGEFQVEFASGASITEDTSAALPFATTMWVVDNSDNKIYAYDLETKAYEASKDFDTLSAAGNNDPGGLWSDGITMWVVDDGDDRIYGYDLSTKAYEVSRDFHPSRLGSAGNNNPRGLWSDGVTMWVVDDGNDKIYAYDLETKARVASREFNTLSAAGNNDPYGLWSDGTTMWVSDRDDDKIYAYDRTTKAHEASRDFDTLSAAGNNNPRALWSAGTTMWVADLDDGKIYAYDLTTKAHDSSKDFDTLSAAGNNNPFGIWSSGTPLCAGCTNQDFLVVVTDKNNSVTLQEPISRPDRRFNYYERRHPSGAITSSNSMSLLDITLEDSGDDGLPTTWESFVLNISTSVGGLDEVHSMAVFEGSTRLFSTSTFPPSGVTVALSSFSVPNGMTRTVSVHLTFEDTGIRDGNELRFLLSTVTATTEGFSTLPDPQVDLTSTAVIDIQATRLVNSPSLGSRVTLERGVAMMFSLQAVNPDGLIDTDESSGLKISMDGVSDGDLGDYIDPDPSSPSLSSGTFSMVYSFPMSIPTSSPRTLRIEDNDAGSGNPTGIAIANPFEVELIVEDTSGPVLAMGTPLNPAPGATSVLPGGSLTLKFDEPMMTEAAGGRYLVIGREGTIPHAISIESSDASRISLSDAGRTVTITPEFPGISGGGVLVISVQDGFLKDVGGGNPWISGTDPASMADASKVDPELPQYPGPSPPSQRIWTFETVISSVSDVEITGGSGAPLGAGGSFLFQLTFTDPVYNSLQESHIAIVFTPSAGTDLPDVSNFGVLIQKRNDLEYSIQITEVTGEGSLNIRLQNVRFESGGAQHDFPENPAASYLVDTNPPSLFIATPPSYRLLDDLGGTFMMEPPGSGRIITTQEFTIRRDYTLELEALFQNGVVLRRDFRISVIDPGNTNPRLQLSSTEIEVGFPGRQVGILSVPGLSRSDWVYSFSDSSAEFMVDTTGPTDTARIITSVELIERRDYEIFIAAVSGSILMNRRFLIRVMDPINTEQYLEISSREIDIGPSDREVGSVTVANRVSGPYDTHTPTIRGTMGSDAQGLAPPQISVGEFSGPATTDCSMAPEPCTWEVTIPVLYGLRNGSHQVRASVRDAAGNLAEVWEEIQVDSVTEIMGTETQRGLCPAGTSALTESALNVVFQESDELDFFGTGSIILALSPGFQFDEDHTPMLEMEIVGSGSPSVSDTQIVMVRVLPGATRLELELSYLGGIEKVKYSIRNIQIRNTSDLVETGTLSLDPDSDHIFSGFDPSESIVFARIRSVPLPTPTLGPSGTVRERPKTTMGGSNDHKIEDGQDFDGLVQFSWKELEIHKPGGTGSLRTSTTTSMGTTTTTSEYDDLFFLPASPRSYNMVVYEDEAMTSPTKTFTNLDESILGLLDMRKTLTSPFNPSQKDLFDQGIFSSWLRFEAIGAPDCVSESLRLSVAIFDAFTDRDRILDPNSFTLSVSDGIETRLSSFSGLVDDSPLSLDFAPSGDAGGKFRIESDKLVTNQSLSSGQEEITLTATTKEGVVRTQSFAINVLPNPTTTSLELSSLEVAHGNVVVGTAEVRNPHVDHPNYNFELVEDGDAGGRFELDGAELKTRGALEAKIYTITVKAQPTSATSDTTYTYTKSFDINVIASPLQLAIVLSSMEVAAETVDAEVGEVRVANTNPGSYTATFSGNYIVDGSVPPTDTCPTQTHCATFLYGNSQPGTPAIPISFTLERDGVVAKREEAFTVDHDDFIALTSREVAVCWSQERFEIPLSMEYIDNYASRSLPFVRIYPVVSRLSGEISDYEDSSLNVLFENPPDVTHGVGTAIMRGGNPAWVLKTRELILGYDDSVEHPFQIFAVFFDSVADSEIHQGSSTEFKLLSRPGSRINLTGVTRSGSPPTLDPVSYCHDFDGELDIDIDYWAPDITTVNTVGTASPVETKIMVDTAQGYTVTVVEVVGSTETTIIDSYSVTGRSFFTPTDPKGDGSGISPGSYLYGLDYDFVSPRGCVVTASITGWSVTIEPNPATPELTEGSYHNQGELNSEGVYQLEYCSEGEMPNLRVMAGPGLVPKWFDNSNLAIDDADLLGVGGELMVGIAAFGSTTIRERTDLNFGLTVTNTSSGCESPRRSIKVTGYQLPSPPILNTAPSSAVGISQYSFEGGLYPFQYCLDEDQIATIEDLTLTTTLGNLPGGDPTSHFGWWVEMDSGDDPPPTKVSGNTITQSVLLGKNPGESLDPGSYSFLISLTTNDKSEIAPGRLASEKAVLFKGCRSNPTRVSMELLTPPAPIDSGGFSTGGGAGFDASSRVYYLCAPDDFDAVSPPPNLDSDSRYRWHHVTETTGPGGAVTEMSQSLGDTQRLRRFDVEGLLVEGQTIFEVERFENVDIESGLEGCPSQSVRITVDLYTSPPVLDIIGSGRGNVGGGAVTGAVSTDGHGTSDADYNFYLCESTLDLTNPQTLLTASSNYMAPVGRDYLFEWFRSEPIRDDISPIDVSDEGNERLENVNAVDLGIRMTGEPVRPVFWVRQVANTVVSAGFQGCPSEAVSVELEIYADPAAPRLHADRSDTDPTNDLVEVSSSTEGVARYEIFYCDYENIQPIRVLEDDDLEDQFNWYRTVGGTAEPNAAFEGMGLNLENTNVVSGSSMTPLDLLRPPGGYTDAANRVYAFEIRRQLTIQGCEGAATQLQIQILGKPDTPTNLTPPPAAGEPSLTLCESQGNLPVLSSGWTSSDPDIETVLFRWYVGEDDGSMKFLEQIPASRDASLSPPGFKQQFTDRNFASNSNTASVATTYKVSVASDELARLTSNTFEGCESDRIEIVVWSIPKPARPKIRGVDAELDGAARSCPDTGPTTCPFTRSICPDSDDRVEISLVVDQIQLNQGRHLAYKAYVGSSADGSDVETFYDSSDPSTTAQKPTYTLEGEFFGGELLVRTITVEDQGCASDPITVNMNVSNSPRPQISWKGITKGKKTVLRVSESNPRLQSSLLTEARISFTPKGGDEQVLVDLGPDIPSRLNRVIAIENGFDEPGEHVIGVVMATAGCTSSVTRAFRILEHIVLGADEYLERFNDETHGWFAETRSNIGFDDDRINSWNMRGSSFPKDCRTDDRYNIQALYGEDDDDSGDVGGMWFTGSQSTDEDGIVVCDLSDYQPGEDSWVYSPMFDITQLDEPSVSFVFKHQFGDSRDGVVFQYSVDNGESWTNLGNFREVYRVEGVPVFEASGVQWYNQDRIGSLGHYLAGVSGANTAFNPDGVGWSLPTSGTVSSQWHSASHSLTSIGQNFEDPAREMVRFRFALHSNDSDHHEGFAFDDFRILSEKVGVLVESFFDPYQQQSSLNNREIMETIDRLVEAEAPNVLWVNYPTTLDTSATVSDVPSGLQDATDDLLFPNSVDFISRGGYYSIARTPTSVVSGEVKQPKLETDETEFRILGWSSQSLAAATFRVTRFEISIEEAPGSNPEVLDLQGTITPRVNIEADALIAFRYIVVESTLDLNNPEVGFDFDRSNFEVGDEIKFLARKILPNPSGYVFRGSELGKDIPKLTDRVSWKIQGLLNPQNLEVIAIVQDETTKEIYHAEKISIAGKSNNILRASEASTVKPPRLLVFPSPSRGTVYLQKLGALRGKVWDWVVHDMSGRNILRGTGLGEDLTMLRLGVAPGVYFISTGDGLTSRIVVE